MSAQPSASWSKPEQPRIPSREETIGKLALRFQGANAASEEAEEARIRLLIEDTAHLSPEILHLAVKQGVKDTWEFMPSAKQICTEAKFFLDMERIPTFERPTAIADQSTRRLSDDADTDALLRETFDKLNAGHNKLTGGNLPGHAPAKPLHAGPPRAPTAEDYAALKAIPSALPVTDASPSLKALAAKLAGQVVA